MSPDDPTEPRREPALDRTLGLSLLTFYGLGNILGAGIYVLVGKVAGLAGIYVPAAFLVTAVVVGLTALTYAELSARFPMSAGEAVYVYEGFGRRHLSIAAGGMLVLVGTISASAIVRGFVGYLEIFVSMPDGLPVVVLIVLLTALAVWGIRQALIWAALFTILEVLGLLLVIGVNAPVLAELPGHWEVLFPPADATVWSGIFLGAFLAFYAFIGFEDMVNVAEEVEYPHRTLPRAIVLALLAATLLYMMVGLVAVLAVEPKVLAQSDAPLALLYQKATGRPPVLISIISIAAVVNGALIQIIMVSRVLYGMSHQKWIPGVFGRVNQRTHTPVVATLTVAVAITLLALWFPLEQLARLTSYIVLIMFCLVNVSLCRIKIRNPVVDGAYQNPFWIPVAGALTSAAMLLFQSWSLGQ